MNTPIVYRPDFLGPATADYFFDTLWKELEWVRLGSTPRREYYCSRMDNPQPYTYGSGAHARTYQPQPLHKCLLTVWSLLEGLSGHRFEVCFLNGYEDGRDHLGWHADDSPEMDDDRPIAIVSLGAEREIWFRESPRKVTLGPGVLTFGDTRTKIASLEVDVSPGVTDRLLLQHGSLCLMQPGMQDTHQHRIPKSPLHDCGPRISFTFRGYAA